MKTAVFVALSTAALASAHEARAPLDLGLDLGDLVDVDVCVDLNLKLPLGINLDTGDCPSHEPPEGHVNVWHPPHHVPIDDCDQTDEDGWHYVRPCGCGEHEHIWTTSTLTQTHVSTIYDCPPAVTNCPARQTTVTVSASTTVCPVPVTSTPVVPVPSKPAVTISTSTIQIVPPVTQTPPTQAPPTQAPPATQPPVTQAPPTQAPPAPTTPAVQVPPTPEYPTQVHTPVGTGSYSMPPPPMGTAPGVPGGNNTIPPVMAGASTNGQVGILAAAGFVVALFL
ncbi:F-box-like domain-containing protein [Purpureocillium lavendulum]|uniref:F-box-like domain-containing protein n=1 Tax=Purpureocillium lavendulum TaxID=1247861 RepID=A0AB34FYA1_9HYPO|nr:F-box-like domain-containing protein [Purpureocillium lavendulum]